MDEKDKKYFDRIAFDMKNSDAELSIINFLDKKKVAPYWVNTSSNGLVGKLLKESDSGIKEKMEELLKGNSIHSETDEEMIYSQLGKKQDAIWSLLLSGGYLKVLHFEDHRQFQTLGHRRPEYQGHSIYFFIFHPPTTQKAKRQD